MFIETMSVLIFLALIYLIYRVSKSRPEGKTDVTGFGQVMSEIGVLKKALEDRAEKEKGDMEKRDKELKEDRILMNEKTEQMLRTMVGTQKRGSVGEQHLKSILSMPLKLGVIVTDLQIGTQKVEFAWNLGHGKYIPIDSKLPQIEELYKEYEESNNPEEQKKLKKGIVSIIKKSAEEAEKYKNKPNTIDKVIVAVPDAFMDMFPEINSNFKRTGILVCGYSYVFFFGHYLAEYYNKMLETGDIGFYQHCLEEITSILKEIEDKTNSIDRGIKMIDNANREIKTQVIEAERHKVKGKKTVPLVVKER